jgi:hypothetical protein
MALKSNPFAAEDAKGAKEGKAKSLLENAEGRPELN